MQSWNKDSDSETFIPFLPLHHPNPRSLHLPADLQQVSTGRVVLTLYHDNLLWGVSRHGVPVVIYFDYPHLHYYHPSHSPSSVSIHETHFKTQTKPPLLSELPGTLPNDDNLSVLWGLTHSVLTTGVTPGVPPDIVSTFEMLTSSQASGQESYINKS